VVGVALDCPVEHDRDRVVLPRNDLFQPRRLQADDDAEALAVPAVQLVQCSRPSRIAGVGPGREVVGVRQRDCAPFDDPQRDDFDPGRDVFDRRPDGMRQLRGPRPAIAAVTPFRISRSDPCQ
jgi:hypothetical protein